MEVLVHQLKQAIDTIHLLRVEIDLVSERIVQIRNEDNSARLDGHWKLLISNLADLVDDVDESIPVIKQSSFYGDFLRMRAPIKENFKLAAIKWKSRTRYDYYTIRNRQRLRHNRKSNDE